MVALPCETRHVYIYTVCSLHGGAQEVFGDDQSAQDDKW
jgi:hypothetical protein